MLPFLFHQTLSVLLIIFTYSIPLLSSIRAVYNRDKESYHQWLTYFLLQVILTPIFQILRLHPLLRLLVILWLSLPKFQGALFVYDQIVNVIMEKYNVEQRIEDRIEVARDAIKDVAWSIARDIGWSTLCQIGELVTIVAAPPTVHDGDSQLSPASATDGNDGKVLSIDTKQEVDEMKIKTNMTRKPSHSVIGSLSSFSSADSLSKIIMQEDGAELEVYRQDFVQMLQQGLYVFASYSTGTDKDANAFRLRVLFYDDDVTCIDEIKHECFILQPVEVNESSAMSADDVEMIPMEDIHAFRPVGTNGIQFLTNATASREEEAEVVLNDQDNETTSDNKETLPPPILVNAESMTSPNSTSDFGASLSLKVASVEDRILAEIVLSNSQDRETLLHGLRTCFITHVRTTISSMRMCTQQVTNADERKVVGDVDGSARSEYKGGEFVGDHDSKASAYANVLEGDKNDDDDEDDNSDIPLSVDSENESRDNNIEALPDQEKNDDDGMQPTPPQNIDGISEAQ